MAINRDILSEIKNAKEITEKTRDFLLWAVDFEEKSLDMDTPHFKKEINSQLDQLLGNESDDEVADRETRP